jgi:hypothetical protein
MMSLTIKHPTKTREGRSMTDSTTPVKERSTPSADPFGPGNAAGRAKDVYEQLLALADRVGAAYVNAYQKIALDIGDAQEKLLRADRFNAFTEVPPAIGFAASSPLGDATDHAVGLGGPLLRMSTKIGRAYVDAHEQAALAAAECRDALAARGTTPIVKTIHSARADLLREVAGTYASTARALIG